MTIEETKELIKVMQAYVDGKEIEYKNKTAEMWTPCKSPIWQMDSLCYRIKPQPTYRPFKSAEEVMEAIKEHGNLVRMYTWEDWRPIITIHSDEVFVWGIERAFEFEKALRDISFADGTPFGIKED